MMLDSNSIQFLILGSVIVGVISASLPRDIGKLIALLGSFPIVFLLIAAALLGTKTTGILDSITLLNWFIENFIPLIVAYAFECAGVGIVEAIRTRFNI